MTQWGAVAQPAAQTFHQSFGDVYCTLVSDLLTRDVLYDTRAVSIPFSELLCALQLVYQRRRKQTSGLAFAIVAGPGAPPPPPERFQDRKAEGLSATKHAMCERVPMGCQSTPVLRGTHSLSLF